MQCKSTAALSLVEGLSNNNSKTPHNVSDIFGVWHSNKLRVTAATPPDIIKISVFNTPT